MSDPLMDTKQKMIELFDRSQEADYWKTIDEIAREVNADQNIVH